MQKKSKILLFTTAFRPMIGGSEIALEEMVYRLPDIFFDIITPKYGNEYKKLEMGNNFCIHRVGFGFKSAKIIFPILGFIKAWQLIISNKYSAVHAYQASYGGGAAWLVKLFSPHLPFILTMQEGKRLDKQPFMLNWFRGLIIKKADIITVISNYLREYVNKTAKNKKIFLIPNGVDLQKFQIPDLKIKNPNIKTIITVSRLVEKNGIGDLIDAVALMTNGKSAENEKRKTENIKLLIIGNGSLEESLKLKVESLKLQNVQFAGETKPDQVPKYLSEADVFVRPSLSEGLGTAFLEAMAAGLPVVATPVGGIPDFLKNGETGLFCRVGDPEDIADKINTVLSDEQLRNKLVFNGRKLVEERYDWNQIAMKFKNIYDSI